MSRFSRRPSLKDQKGVAMMMALVTFLILSVLIGELAYETGVYNGIVWRQVDQFRARLLARSALRLALLQVTGAEKARAKAKSLGLGESSSLTDQIWKTPLILPPPSPPGLTENDKQSLDAFGKALGLDGSLSVSIAGENGRINLNQMVWLKEDKEGYALDGAGGEGQGQGQGQGPAQGQGQSQGQKAMSPEERKKNLEKNQQVVADVIEQLLENKRQSDVSFRDRYTGVTGQVIAGNIAAWINPEVKNDGDGRDKYEYYARLEPEKYGLKDGPMASESELYMIKGIDDPLANLLMDSFTIQETSALNVNEISSTMLRAIIPELSEGDADLVTKRREDETQGGAFKSEDEFWQYLQTLGNYKEAESRVKNQGLKLLGGETSFRVTVTAKSGSASKTWLARIGPALPAPKDPNEATRVAAPVRGGGEDGTGPSDGANNPAGKNDNKPFNILYLKAD